MLSEGQRRRGRGADLVAGFVECYGRPATEALLNGLEVIPRKAVDYQAESLPDGFVRAREIELVDLAPAALRRRLATGGAAREGRKLLDELGGGLLEVRAIDVASGLIQAARRAALASS